MCEHDHVDERVVAGCRGNDEIQCSSAGAGAPVSSASQEDTCVWKELQSEVDSNDPDSASLCVSGDLQTEMGV